MTEPRRSAALWQHPIAQGVQRFFIWWWSELIGIIPERFRYSRSGYQQHLVLQVVGEAVRVIQCRGSEPQDLALLPLVSEELAENRKAAAVLGGAQGGSSRIILQLHPQQVLRKTVLLPRAAKENLRQVLAFEMDRQTPFRAEQVYYDFRVLDGRTEGAQMQVQLIVVARSVLDTLLDRLVRAGLQPDVVEVQGNHPESTACAPPVFNLLPEERRQREDFSGLRLNLALGVVAALLLVVSLFIPLLQMNQAIARLEAEVEKAKAAASEVLAMRGELKKRLEEAHFLIEKKEQAPPVIDSLAELTRILPDDTWLQNFELKGHTVHIQGESKMASALVGLIEQSEMFRDTTFRSPVTQNPSTGRERFQISAEIVPGTTFQ